MKRIIFTLSFLFLIGCTSLQPMKQGVKSQQIANNLDVSKVTINAINFSTMRKNLGVDFAPGSIKINGEELGDFSKNEQIFTQFLSPGSNLIEIALPGHQQYKHAIASIRFNVEPNTHYFFDYGFDTLLGSMRSEIKFVKKEPYKSLSMQPKQEVTNKANDKQNKIDNAKKVCIELGFKSNTENFGNCVLKLMNQ